MFEKIIEKLGPLKALVIARMTGSVTRRYPFEQPLVSSEFRGKIEVDEEKCIGCGACVNVCPSNALILKENSGHKILEYFVGRCIYCWRCIDVCPLQAIKGTTEFELASSSIEDLYELLIIDVVKCRYCGKSSTTTAMKNYILEKTRYAEEYIDLDPQCRRKKLVKAIEARFGYHES